MGQAQPNDNQKMITLVTEGGTTIHMNYGHFMTVKTVVEFLGTEKAMRIFDGLSLTEANAVKRRSWLK